VPCAAVPSLTAPLRRLSPPRPRQLPTPYALPRASPSLPHTAPTPGPHPRPRPLPQDKVNMSVAIIPMAQDYGWSPAVSGLVQSAFFWGYILSQLPGGYLSSRYGGRATLPAGVAMWSLATAAVPVLAATVPGLCVSRAAVGLGEAVAPSAATDMVARIVPPEERSRAVSFVFAGLHFGSIAGLLAAPWLISNLGWPSVFVAFGAAGLMWTAWFEALMRGLAHGDPNTAAALTADRLTGSSSSGSEADGGGAAAEHGSGGGHAAGPLAGHIPWRAFLRSRGVRALMYTHFWWVRRGAGAPRGGEARSVDGQPAGCPLRVAGRWDGSRA
jgi:ACS family sodium-dependent inorganic phosphate cotransporter